MPDKLGEEVGAIASFEYSGCKFRLPKELVPLAPAVWLSHDVKPNDAVIAALRKHFLVRDVADILKLDPRVVKGMGDEVCTAVQAMLQRAGITWSAAACPPSS